MKFPKFTQQLFLFLGATVIFLNVAPCCFSKEMEIGLATMNVDGRLPSLSQVNDFEQKLERPIQTLNWFMGFNGEKKELPPFPSQQVNQFKNQNVVLMLTWELWGETRDKAGNMKDPFLKINDGSLDDYIRQYARKIKKFGRPFRLRFAHEMIQDDNPESKGWYPWQDSPENFKSAYIRIHRIFKEEAVTNVEFVWSINFSPSSFEVIKKYYPGKEFVDWIGIDGYNWDGQDFDGIFKTAYESIVGHPEVFGEKPIMLSEIGVGEEPLKFTLNKPSWIKDAFVRLKNEYPRIRSLYWFQVKKERDWRLDSSEESWQAFKSSVSILRSR